MNDLLYFTLLVGGVITLSGGLQAVVTKKWLTINYKKTTSDSIGTLFARVWGVNVFMLGALMITASQTPTYATVIALASIFSKGLLSLIIAFSEQGRLRQPMKVVMLLDSLIALLLTAGLIGETLAL